MYVTSRATAKIITVYKKFSKGIFAAYKIPLKVILCLT
jgi:hypothetical protein